MEAFISRGKHGRIGTRSPKDVRLCHFMLSFCRGVQRNVQRLKTHVQNHFSQCFLLINWRRRGDLLKLPAPVEYFVANRFLIFRARAYQLRISWVESFSSLPAARASLTRVTVTHMVYVSLWTMKMNLTNSETLSGDSSLRRP